MTKEIILPRSGEKVKNIRHTHPEGGRFHPSTHRKRPTTIRKTDQLSICGSGYDEESEESAKVDFAHKCSIRHTVETPVPGYINPEYHAIKYDVSLSHAACS